MAEYTAADLERARGIVDNLAAGARSKRDHERKFRDDIENGLSIADLETHADQFYDELDLIDYLGLDFPAISIDGAPVPVALTEALADGTGLPLGSEPAFWRRFAPPSFFRDRFNQDLRRSMRRFGERTTWIPGHRADETFVARASEFLASRISGSRSLSSGSPPPGGPPPAKFKMHKFNGGPPTQVVGCSFSVHTLSANLSAYWSGAYLIRSNYHGAPTTPAVGPLQAGTYIFGINGGAYGTAIQWDTNKVCTLPGANSVHLQY